MVGLVSASSIWLTSQEIQQIIADKHQEVASYKDIGENLKEYFIADAVLQVGHALTEVDENWNSLCKKVEEIAKKLVSDNERVQSLQGQVADLKIWLTETEQRLSNLEPAGVEPERVKEQLVTQAVSDDSVVVKSGIH